MAIDSYVNLQAAIADWLNRSDLASVIPSFIELAEGELRKDPRTRRKRSIVFPVTADGIALPADFYSLESWAHAGPTYFGPISTVGDDQIERLKLRVGETGAPRYVALLDGKARFAPAPDQTYTTEMTYWRTFERLGSGRLTNWLLQEAPHVYLYASLIQATPYLKDDERLPVWEAKLEAALEKLHLATWDQHVGGTMRERHRVFGG